MSRNAIEESIEQSTETSLVLMLDGIDRHIYERVEDLRVLVEEHSIAAAASSSNLEFDKTARIEEHIKTIDRDWTAGKETPFIMELLDNELSRTLTKRNEIYRKTQGSRGFPEIFVTNKYGVVIGSTGRTSDYLQADELWYQKATAEKALWVGEVEYDVSSKSFSSEVVINLYDEAGDFAGILNATLDTKEMIGILEEFVAAIGIEGPNLRLISRQGNILYPMPAGESFQQVENDGDFVGVDDGAEAEPLGQSDRPVGGVVVHQDDLLDRALGNVLQGPLEGPLGVVGRKHRDDLHGSGILSNAARRNSQGAGVRAILTDGA